MKCLEIVLAAMVVGAVASGASGSSVNIVNSINDLQTVTSTSNMAIAPMPSLVASQTAGTGVTTSTTSYNFSGSGFSVAMQHQRSGVATHLC